MFALSLCNFGGREHPHAVHGHTPTIDAVGWYAKVEGDPVTYPIAVGGAALNLTQKPALGNLCTGVGGVVNLGTTVTLTANPAKLRDLVMLAHYTIS